MLKNNRPCILIRGGGDLATGVALRLNRAGMKIVINELAQPLAVRRTVSFAEAVYVGQITVEGTTARLARADQIDEILSRNEIPVLVDPDANILTAMRNAYHVVVDGRLLKTRPQPLPVEVPLHIGLGPGFLAGHDCHAVVETCRGHTMGRVYWQGESLPDSGQPEGDPHRILRAGVDGIVVAHTNIGEHLEEGQMIAEIQQPITPREKRNPQAGLQDSLGAPLPQRNTYRLSSPFKGVLRGLIHPGFHVTYGMKIGDVDPRDDSSLCYLVSDKALAVGGGVLEAILSRPDIRKKLWE